MDPGRYGRQQGWENNSAFDGYGAVHEANFRVGEYDDRRFADERYRRDNIHPRNAFHRDMPERENYPPSSAVDPWPQIRRRSHENEVDRFHDYDNFRDGYRDDDNIRAYEHDRSSRFGRRDSSNSAYDDYDYKARSRERDVDYDRRSYDSDYERGGKRERGWRSRESRDCDNEKRGSSRELDRSRSPRKHDRSRSRGRDDHYRSRSPRGRSQGRDYRENSHDDGRHERGDRRRDREYSHESYSVVPSATVVVRGLSQKTTEEDLYQILAEWGPLRHVRVIKERDSGISRGFAFMDFTSVGAARALMDKVGDDGLVVDGRKLYFEYSSKSTGGTGGSSLGPDNAFKSGHSSHRNMTVPSDWICAICGCNNFARRTACFQCNEPRTDDATAVEMGSSHSNRMSRKGDTGPTHVLVVRGLDENADEGMLRYEFSKHAPIKDIRLVRDKFTHVSRGFAFVHFHTVEDASKALDATNGITLEKNGQMLRVAFAKSVIGAGSGGPSGSSHSSSLAAAAIEAAAFSQQYDAVGWAPKEYNPDEKQSTGGQEPSGCAVNSSKNASAPQSGFVWDEASGYYYDASSGFYYDGNTGLYYDGNNGIWYTFDQQTQQYTPCTDQNDKKIAEKQAETPKAADNSTATKVVISAPAATITSNEKAASLHDAVQAAANAALAAEKKEKERLKEIRLASKSSILANKKKMNNVLSMWKQRSVEGQAPRVALEGNHPATSADGRSNSVVASAQNRYKIDTVTIKENPPTNSALTSTTAAEPLEKPKPVGNISGGTIMGVIRGSGRGVVKSDTSYAGPVVGASLPAKTDAPASATPFRTDLSALGSYTSPVPAGSSKRRFSELPVQPTTATREQPQTGYRDRAAERRSLYGSSSSLSLGDNISDREAGDSYHDSGSRRGLADPTPFPPGVGGGRGSGEVTEQNYEAATAEKAIDENNVGNRMLRNMGWQEGLGLGKDGSGIIEPVQAQAVEKRAGLGSQQKKPTDPDLEVHAGDSYRMAIQKKAIARFREMN